MPFSNQEIDVLRKPLRGTPSPTTTTNRANLHEKMLRAMESELGLQAVEMWFESGQAMAVVNHQQPVRVLIEAPSEFHLNRIKTRYTRGLHQAALSALGPDVDVVFQVRAATIQSGPPDDDSPIRLLAGAVSPQIPVDSDSTGNHSRTAAVTRSNPTANCRPFHFGETNRLIRAGVEQMFGHVGQISPLVVYGPTGCGKTHLLQRIVFDAKRKHRLKRCVYLSAEQFTTCFVESLRGTGLPIFRRKYRDLDLLAIDDVHFFAGKRATLAEFQHTVDHLARNGKQVVLATDRPPNDLERLGPEVTARMTSGLVCPLNYPDIESRKQILLELCRDRQFEIGDDVIDLISRNLVRDVRRLSGAINRIHAFSVASGMAIEVETARRALTDLFAINGVVTSLDKIEQVVCEFCQICPSDLKSNSRQKKISAARMLAIYLSRRHTSNACSEIGDYYGGRSHSTVIAAQKKVASWLDGNQSIDLPHAKYLVQDALVRIESNLRIG